MGVHCNSVFFIHFLKRNELKILFSTSGDLRQIPNREKRVRIKPRPQLRLVRGGSSSLRDDGPNLNCDAALHHHGGEDGDDLHLPSNLFFY